MDHPVPLSGYRQGMSHPHPELKAAPPLPEGGLRVIALGGLGEIGRNMTVFEHAGKLLIVDCGVLFPEETQPGVDVILPDFTSIRDRLDDIVAVVLTHGHEDHIGGVPYLLRERSDIPVVGSKLTLAFLEAKLKEHGIRPRTVRVREGDRRGFGPFDCEFVAVNHSIPDSLAVAIRTRAGMVLHTGDFKMDQCATRRSDTSPPQAGQTRREVCWVRWLTWIRKVKGTRACQETGDRAQVPGAVRRGTRAVWRKLDCLNPNLQRQQFTATGTAPETGARRDRGRTGSPWSTFAAGAMPNEGIEGDEWGAWAVLIVCQRRTWDHRPSTAGGDGVPVVVAGFTPGRGERESRSQGEGAQVVRTPATPGRYAKCRALTQCSVS
jgi:hypothetical protein